MDRDSPKRHNDADDSTNYSHLNNLIIDALNPETKELEIGNNLPSKKTIVNNPCTHPGDRVVTGISFPNRLTGQSSPQSSTARSQNFAAIMNSTTDKTYNAKSETQDHIDKQAKNSYGENFSSLPNSKTIGHSSIPNFRMATHSYSGINVPNLKLVTDGIHDSKFVYETETLTRKNKSQIHVIDQKMEFDETLFEPYVAKKETNDSTTFNQEIRTSKELVNLVPLNACFSDAVQTSTPLATPRKKKKIKKINDSFTKISDPWTSSMQGDESNDTTKTELYFENDFIINSEQKTIPEPMTDAQEFEQLMIEESSLDFKVHVATYQNFDLDMLSLLSEEGVDASSSSSNSITHTSFETPLDSDLQNSSSLHGASFSRQTVDVGLYTSRSSVCSNLSDEECLMPVNDTDDIPSFPPPFVTSKTHPTSINSSPDANKHVNDFSKEDLLRWNSFPETFETMIASYKESGLAMSAATFHSNTSLYSDEGVHVSS